ncbi:MAG TPA: hypothetical protein VF883_17235 [Thermoanaerobaculia bacterium]|jgi:hypothetical protein
MRKFVLVLLALALPLSAATFDNIIVRNGNHSYVHTNRHAPDTESLGRHFAYFERNGVGYVIRDAATLQRIERVLQPQVQLGNEQARLGQQQAALGQKQAALGARQAALGAQQISARGARASELQRRQSELAEQQRELADQQRPLADEQRELAEKQREASRVALGRMEKLFDEAVRSGVAKRR